MKNKTINNLEITTLIATPIVLTLIGFGYLVNTQFYPNLFGFSFENTSGNNVFRAVGAMYISLCIFWFMSVKNESWRKGALLSIAFFMGGLVVGRIISICIDGMPHGLIWAFFFGEIFTCLQALFIYKKKYSTK